ncbi:Polyphosphate kinase [Planctomycetales bacterium 10988]|nr:Polyphosphate kinase [Planctomycetales bacterium 10988]
MSVETRSWLDAYEDRDLSWLEFNRRVLHEALDDRTPLLERLKFLAIFTSNLDEFFMKRVGLLRQQLKVGKNTPNPAGLSIRSRLAAIREKVIPMLKQQAEVFSKTLVPELAEHGIRLTKWQSLTPEQQESAARYFHQNIFPALTPLALDPGHPFPFVSNLSTSLGVVLRHPDSEEWLFARIKVPTTLPQWISIPEEVDKGTEFYISLHEIIRHNLQSLFPEMIVLDTMLFRVSRNADVEVEDEDAASVREIVAEELRQRRFAGVVRLEHAPKPNRWVLDLLKRQFQITDSDIYELPAELDYTGLFPIASLGTPELSEPPWTPVPPPSLSDDASDIFSVIRAGNFLVHHPYDSFNASVERFIRTAADDPQVVAIKMTVYRVGDNTPFIRSLIRAAERGKQVACLVEVQARFDEERNLQWAQALENAGAHVIYGVLGLKTHTKIALVVRQEAEGLRCYTHIGTGNYHVKTARLYTDLGLFSCDPALTSDVVELFHYLTGRSRKKNYRKLLVAPANMRDRFLQMIDHEIEFHKRGEPAEIIAKMNQLEDPQMCQALVRASQEGVPITMIVRGFCCLRAGVEGVTENMKVLSVIGRFLEHSRIFYFRNGHEDHLKGLYYLGSADWMYRNLSNRVEAITPVENVVLREKLWHILDVMQQDQRNCWEMQPDGSYIQRTPDETATGPARVGTHETMMQDARHHAHITKESHMPFYP